MAHPLRSPGLVRGLLAATLLGCLGVACDRGATEAPEATEPAAAAERVENESLDLTLARVPADLVLLENGERVRLGLTEGEGEIQIEVGEPSDFGIDVVAIANEQQADFGATPGGEFFGAQMLVTPFGQATYARGRYDGEDGSRVEETRAYLVHPSANRLITVTYSYPAADDSRERVAQLLEVIGELEPREQAPAAAEPAGETG